MAFTRCVKCGELRFDKHVNRCGSCGSSDIKVRLESDWEWHPDEYRLNIFLVGLTC